jgi:hypothetical protein
LIEVAAKLVGLDGRCVRKLVTESMQGRVETTINPGSLTLDDIDRAVSAKAFQGPIRDRSMNGAGDATD